MRLLTPIVLVVLGLFMTGCSVTRTVNPTVKVDTDGTKYKEVTYTVKSDVLCNGSCK